MNESDTSSDGTDRYQYVDIHLCEECGDGFTPGNRVVSLSDGYVTGKDEYEVNNRRFFHRDCWSDSEYVETDTEQEARR